MGRRKRIHINQHVLKKNLKEGASEPPITIKVGSENIYASGVAILGPSVLRYSPHKPLLSCGARLLLETNADLEVDGKIIE